MNPNPPSSQSIPAHTLLLPVFTTYNQLNDSELAHFVVIFKHYLPHATGFAKLKIIVQPADTLAVHVHSVVTKQISSPTWTFIPPDNEPDVDIEKSSPIDVVYATVSIPTKTAYFRMSVLVQHFMGFNGIDPHIDIIHKSYKHCKPFKDHPRSLTFVHSKVNRQKPILIHGKP
jgi:hypothetical protein